MSKARLSKPSDIIDALSAFKAEVGPEAYVDITLSASSWVQPSMSFSLYPRGVGHGDAAFRLKGDDFADLIDEARAKWADFIDVNTIRDIRSMALAIIEITADQGSCTDAALRQKFNAEMVERLGERAVVDANTMAAGGPFKITTLGGANQNEAA